MAVLNASVSSSPQLSAPVCKCLSFATWHCVGTQGSCRPLTSKYIDKQNLYWTVVHVNCSISAVPYPKYLPNSYLRLVLSLAFEFSNAKDVSTLTDSVLESHTAITTTGKQSGGHKTTNGRYWDIHGICSTPTWLKSSGHAWLCLSHAGYYSLVVGVRVATDRPRCGTGLVPLAPVTWLRFQSACPSTVFQLWLPEPAEKPWGHHKDINKFKGYEL